jgi:DNA-directed RNA polymerase subunit RPC12/RpoP
MHAVKPFKGLELITTVKDVENVDNLLNLSGDGARLMCDQCNGRSFEVRALVEVDMDLSSHTRYDQVILRGHEIKSISIVKVIKCATCNSTDFIKDRAGGIKNNELKETSVGSG